MKLVNQMALRETAMAARGCTGQFDGLSHWSVCWYVLKYVLSILPFLACFYLMEHSSGMLSMLGIFPPFRLHTTFLTSSWRTGSSTGSLVWLFWEWCLFSTGSCTDCCNILYVSLVQLCSLGEELSLLSSVAEILCDLSCWCYSVVGKRFCCCFMSFLFCDLVLRLHLVLLNCLHTLLDVTIHLFVLASCLGIDFPFLSLNLSLMTEI